MQVLPSKTPVIPSPNKLKKVPGFGGSTRSIEHEEEHDDPTLIGFGQPQSQHARCGNVGTGS